MMNILAKNTKTNVELTNSLRVEFFVEQMIKCEFNIIIGEYQLNNIEMSNI